MIFLMKDGSKNYFIINNIYQNKHLIEIVRNNLFNVDFHTNNEDIEEMMEHTLKKLYVDENIEIEENPFELPLIFKQNEQ